MAGVEGMCEMCGMCGMGRDRMAVSEHDVGDALY